MIIENIFSKMKADNVDLIIIGAKIEGQDICSLFFEKEELMDKAFKALSMDKAFKALSEDLTVYRERKQIVFLKNETLTALALRKIFKIDEVLFAK